MIDGLTITDIDGNMVGVWPVIDANEPRLSLWALSEENEYSPSLLTLAQAVQVRNLLDDFISEFTTLPTRGDLLLQVKNSKITLKCDGCTNDIDPIDAMCSCGTPFNLKNVSCKIIPTE